MSTFVFTAFAEAMGHLNPMLTIARQLRSEGHAIVFACHTLPHTEKAIMANNFRLINIHPSLYGIGLVFLPLTSGFFETFFASRIMFSGLMHYANAIKPILDEVQPDAVVSEFSFLGSCLAAETREIPYALVYHAGLSFRGEGIPPFASGLPIGEPLGKKGQRYQRLVNFMERSIDGSIARVRKRLGLPSGQKQYLTCPASPWLTLVLTSEATEAPRFPLPPTFFFIGPCFAGRKDAQAEEFPFEQFSTEKPKIYISLGTVFNKKPQVFQKMIEAFADGRYQLIVSAGKAFARLRAQSLPPYVLLFERVPQVEVLARVDAVISHGGNNTTNETLAAGKPLLVMPVGGEQGDNASRVVYLGAGLRADMKRSTSQEIKEKVTRLIEEPAFGQKARELAEALAMTQGPVTAARFIEHVAQTKQPLLRPEGYPLTVTRDLAPPWEERKKSRR
jgi:MGT family glycosyltransferase